MRQRQFSAAMTAAIAKGKTPPANVVKLPKHWRRQKKAAPKFTRYSDDERRKIEAEVKQSRRGPVDTVVLLDRLERFGRNYAALSMDRGRLKSFVATEKQAAKFRGQLAEEDRLPPEWQMPPELRQRLADAVGEAERFCQERIFQLGRSYSLRIVGIKEAGPNYTRGCSASSRTLPELTISSTPPTRSRHTLAEAEPPRNQNARLAPLDHYCSLLFGMWMEIGGDWRSKSGSTKGGSAAAFISECAGPVAGKTSTTVGAIRKRLSRLVKGGAIVAMDGSADVARRRRGEFGQDGNDKPGQTKHD
jgi:hypothetical protein